VAATLSNLGELVLLDGDADWAARRFAETLALAQQVGLVPHTAWALTELGLAAVYQTDKERAAPLLRQALRLARDLRGRPTVAECLAGLAAVTADPAAAARLWARCSGCMTTWHHPSLHSPAPQTAAGRPTGDPGRRSLAGRPG
jgi:hypothetical protein